uniref:Uncharacterized protein n=1 Tax=Kalanchoe fedtschenkoi TaxID=63787 RepID=A0A7N0TJ63_KALFE
MEMKKLRLLRLLFELIFSFSALADAATHGNPANELVQMINFNRSSHRLSNLTTSPGLGCMALQYAESCKGNCSNNTVHCRWNEDDFTEVFAPNCGVELPTFGTLSGHILSCRSKYLKPSLAFDQVVVNDKKAISLVSNKSLIDVGVGIVGDHKGPFFWCVLFSTDKVNSTFVLEGHGEGIKQRKGCFSGSSSHSSSCTSNAHRNHKLSQKYVMAVICIYILQHWIT